MGSRIAEVLDKFRWVAFLLPGIVAAACLGLISNVLRLSEIQIVILGIFLTAPMLIVSCALLYAFLFLVRQVGNLVQKYASNSALVFSVTQSRFAFLSWIIALILSPYLGVNLAVWMEGDGLHRAAQRITTVGLLDSESIWSPLERLLYVNTKGKLNDESYYLALDGRTKKSPWGDAQIEVHLKTKEIFLGWPRAYGQRGGESEIYLSPACRHESNGSPGFLPGPGVVIKEREVAFVVLVDRESGCKEP